MNNLIRFLFRDISLLMGKTILAGSLVFLCHASTILASESVALAHSELFSHTNLGSGSFALNWFRSTFGICGRHLAQARRHPHVQSLSFTSPSAFKLHRAQSQFVTDLRTHRVFAEIFVAAENEGFSFSDIVKSSFHRRLTELEREQSSKRGQFFFLEWIEGKQQLVLMTKAYMSELSSSSNEEYRLRLEPYEDNSRLWVNQSLDQNQKVMNKINLVSKNQQAFSMSEIPSDSDSTIPFFESDHLIYTSLSYRAHKGHQGTEVIFLPDFSHQK